MNQVGLWFQIVSYGLWIAAVFSLAEWLRACQIDGEIVRKVIHIGIGNIIWLAWGFQVPQMLGVTFSLIFSMVALLSYRINILQSMNGVGRKSFGTFFYALSIGLLLAYFWDPLGQSQLFAVIGILVMTWGDALAALVGKRWGNHTYQIGSIQKSWEGSLTMWLITALIVGSLVSVINGFSWLTLGTAAGMAAIVAGLEVFSWRGIDNLTVPLGSAFLSYWLFSS